MRGKEYDEIMRLSARNTNMFGFPSVSILSKYVADLPLLSAWGMLTGTVTRMLGDQWREPNAEREIAHAMLRRSPLTPEDTTLLVRSLYYDHHGNVIQTHESNTLGGQQRDYDCTYQYDLNGNVTALTRKGVDLAMPVMDYTVWNYGTIDDLSLSYEGNRLTKVTDQSSDLTYEGAMDFKDGADQTTEYTYDANGNLTSDRNKGITAIAYNVLNLPSRVEFDDGHIIRYRYAADGRKLRTEYVLSNIMVIDNPGYGPSFSNSPSELQGAGGSVSGGVIDGPPENQLETTLMTRDYCGNVIYRDGALERLQGDYGYMDSTGNYHYYIKDYQGNVRAVIDRSCEVDNRGSDPSVNLRCL